MAPLGRATRRASLVQTTDVTGIVLAGGRSRRFGRDKLREAYRGTSILSHTVLRMGEVCGDIVVVLAPKAAEPELPPDPHVRFARDTVEGQGPLAGVDAGLLACSTEVALVAGGDMPELSPLVLAQMLEVIADGAVDAVALRDGDRLRPLPCVLRVDRAEQIARALLGDGERRLRALLEALRTTGIDDRTWCAVDPARRTLFDVDEPGDLEDR